MNRAQRRARARRRPADFDPFELFELFEDLVLVRVGGDDDCPLCAAFGFGQGHEEQR